MLLRTACQEKKGKEEAALGVPAVEQVANYDRLWRA
jgi:hypothetical protein